MRPSLDRAVEILRGGGVVAFPTETVYGLGADAEREEAVRRVYAIKRRPLGHPVIVHLGDPSQLDAWTRDIPAAARTLAERFWPGALTLVLLRSQRASDLVTGGQDTVAVRVPSHPIARELLARFGGGLVAPSANRFGHVSATRAEHVVADLGDAVDFVVDGGPATIGVESTIVDLAHGAPAILRPGGVTREELEAALGTSLRLHDDAEVRAPGTLPSHYAPRARLEVAGDTKLADARSRALRAEGKRVAVIGGNEPVEMLARELYALLRRADEEGSDVIVVVAPDEGGLGTAVRDRLARAAARL